MSLLERMPTVDQPPEIELTGLFEAVVAETIDGIPVLQQLVDGTWCPSPSGRTFDVVTPIDGSRIAVAQKATTDDVERAIAAAKGGRATIRAMSAAERLAICEDAAEILEQHLDEVADAITIDLGKTPSSARGETETTVQRLEMVREEVRKIFGEYVPGDWMQGTTGTSAVVLREPVGTVSAIGPFNYPLFISATKVIPAIAAGNAVVAKAPSDDPIPLLMFARVMEEAGLPDGVLNVVTGSGSEFGGLLAGHEDISMVSFTGSTSAGWRLAEAAGPKPLHLELGGNAAGIVLADADLDDTVAATVSGAFKGSGQRCSAISRVLVHEAVYDRYVEQALDEAKTWTVGDPRADGVDIGPLVHDGAAKTVQDLVQDAVSKGAERLHGGDVEAAYHEPTMLADVPLDAEIVWEETFGPVLTVVPVRDGDHAVEVANRSRYGLDSSVFTRDLDKAWQVSSQLEVGMVHINAAPRHGVGHYPFGGRTPHSGVGREGLGYSIDECTELKTVVLPTGR